MGFENKAGLNVNNQYGVRSTGGALGRTEEDGHIGYLVFEFTGNSIAEGFIPPTYLPKGALATRYFLRVDEAFALTGTTPALSIGLSASVGTDFVSLSKTELEAIGTKKPASTGNGKLDVASATGLTAASKITTALTGTTPTLSATLGKATLIVEYVNVTKV